MTLNDINCSVEIRCSSTIKSGKKKGSLCSNKAKYDQNGVYLCGLHSKDKNNRKELHTNCKPKNRKSKNSENEEKNITKLIEHLNNRSKIGQILINCLQSDLNIIFDKAEKRNNSRKSHYDFVIYDNNGTRYTIEHKGSYKYKKIQRHDKPWKSGVQFANIGAEKFEIGKLYGKLWYKEYIESNHLKSVYKLENTNPTFNTWYKSDCCNQGDPKTSFGKELKKKYRDEYGNKSSLLSLRRKINTLFLDEINQRPVILKDFTSTMLKKANEFLNEKDIWLQINGDIFDDNPDNICFKWYSKITFDSIEFKTCDSKTDIDIYYHANQGDVKWDIQSTLRWGKGAGFSNLRVDLK